MNFFNEKTAFNNIYYKTRFIIKILQSAEIF